jgi:hypothetical protein
MIICLNSLSFQNEKAAGTVAAGDLAMAGRALHAPISGSMACAQYLSRRLQAALHRHPGASAGRVHGRALLREGMSPKPAERTSGGNRVKAARAKESTSFLKKRSKKLLIS